MEVSYRILIIWWCLINMAHSDTWSWENSEIPEIEASDFEQIQELGVPTHLHLFLEVYSKGCMHCRNLGPVLEEVFHHYSETRHDIHIFKMQGPNNKKFTLDVLKVSGYPTILYFKPGEKTSSEVFKGKRSVQGFKEWIDLVAVPVIEMPEDLGEEGEDIDEIGDSPPFGEMNLDEMEHTLSEGGCASSTVVGEALMELFSEVKGLKSTLEIIVPKMEMITKGQGGGVPRQGTGKLAKFLIFFAGVVVGGIFIFAYAKVTNKKKKAKLTPV